MNLTDRLDQAVDLLKYILCHSNIECDADPQIYDFLKEIGELPDGYIPYWQDDEDNE